MEERWEGEFSAKVKSRSAEEIWALVKDFFNLHKRFPSLSTCYGIYGTNGEPGCIRYCAGFSIPSSDGSASVSALSWSKEKLVAVDDVERSLTYEIVDSSIGFNSYVSTIRVLNLNDEDGCVIEWSFAVDPVQGLVKEDLLGKYHAGLQLMANKMEDEIATSLNG